jgi:hypothetical protein
MSDAQRTKTGPDKCVCAETSMRNCPVHQHPAAEGANAAKPFEPKAKTSADPIAYVIWGDCTFQANNQGAAVKTWRTA